MELAAVEKESGTDTAASTITTEAGRRRGTGTVAEVVGRLERVAETTLLPRSVAVDLE